MKIKESLKGSEESSFALEKEIQASIKLINEEGAGLKEQRDALATQANAEILQIYESCCATKKTASSSRLKTAPAADAISY